MPVVGVLLWATLLTLGWRAAHAKDHGFATPRVQLSFKGKSLLVGLGGAEWDPKKVEETRDALVLPAWGGGYQQAVPSEISEDCVKSLGLSMPVWFNFQSASYSQSGGPGGHPVLPVSFPL